MPTLNSEESRSRDFLVLGLQESGKSTFLAALWHLTAEPSSDGGLKIVDFSGNREYIQQLESAWLNADRLPRTLRSSDNRVVLALAGPSIRGQIRLTLPDLSGEDFRKFFAQREWPASFDEYVRGIDGVLLFVNPRTLVSPIWLTEITAATNVLMGESATRAETESRERRGHHSTNLSNVAPAASLGAAVPLENRWDPEGAPCCAVLVDLLIAISDRREGRRTPLRVAVIVSAWDTMDGMGVSPEAWFSRHVALLDQYIRANTRSYELGVFGVSAQGGDVTDAAERRRLQLLSNPVERIKVVHGGITDHDLTRPLVWLLTPARANE